MLPRTKTEIQPMSETNVEGEPYVRPLTETEINPMCDGEVKP
jgi:hypothetical protein